MGGGYSGVNFGHPKSEVFRNGGGYSGVNFGHPKSEVFWNGGVFRSKLWSSQIWSFPKWGGGGFLVWNSRKGLSGKFGQKFTVQPETCLCITDSLSHTTYVETNKYCANVPSVQLYFSTQLLFNTEHMMWVHNSSYSLTNELYSLPQTQFSLRKGDYVVKLGGGPKCSKNLSQFIPNFSSDIFLHSPRT